MSKRFVERCSFPEWDRRDWRESAWMAEQTTEALMPRRMREAKTMDQASAAERTLPMLGSQPVVSRVVGPQTEADLDAAVERFAQHKGAFGDAYWQAAQELRRIVDSNLWKTRAKDGSPVYTSWHQFVRCELGMSPESARNLLRVATEGSREEVERIGPTKLGLILQAPEDKREELKELAATGASKRDIESRTREANAAKRTPAQREQQKERRESHRRKLEAVTKSIKVDEHEITVAVLVGKVQDLALYALTDGTKKVGKTLPNGAHAHRDLKNDVRETFQLVRKGASWVLRIVAKRNT
jgi:hypothetical protein